MIYYISKIKSSIFFYLDTLLSCSLIDAITAIICETSSCGVSFVNS